MTALANGTLATPKDQVEITARPAARQLISNADGRLSTTATVQLLGFVTLAAVMLYSVYLGRDYVPELFDTLALYCAGLTISKGAVTAYRDKQ
ncbi:MAG: hypothetical protein CR974_03880 [Gammaproteobacteria bacterium]|nr:MAG: hypothetical protein CR974_03880 [Gammaproteobacteria bacterium]